MIDRMTLLRQPALSASLALAYSLLLTGCASPVQRLDGLTNAGIEGRKVAVTICAVAATAGSDLKVWKNGPPPNIDAARESLGSGVGSRSTGGFMKNGQPIVDSKGYPVSYSEQPGDVTTRAYVACLLDVGFKWEKQQ